MAKAVDAATAIREVAERDNAQYPQYRGHWDGWTAVKFTKRVKNKRGMVAFEPGDISILSPDGTKSYSWRNKIDMEVFPKEYVKQVAK
jgi:hypothetical protein